MFRKLKISVVDRMKLNLTVKLKFKQESIMIACFASNVACISYENL